MYVQSATTQSTVKSTTASSSDTAFELNVSDTSNESAEDIIKMYRERLGLNGNLNETMLLQRRQEYIARHEAEFKRDYPLYEKYKDIFTPEYSNYTRQKANAVIRELNAQFPDFRQLSHDAHYGGTQEDRNRYNEMFMDYQAYRSYLQDKYNLEISNGSPFLSSSPEGMKAYNFAIYDQLEAGLSLSEAQGMAHEMSSRFGGMEASLYTANLMKGYPESMEVLISETSSYSGDYNSEIDLREYGFDHSFDYPNYFKKFASDAQGVKARIMYDVELYTFLIENEDKVDQKIEELHQKNEHSPELYIHSEVFATELKKRFEYEYNVAMYAQTFYEQYGERIFANSELQNVQKTLDHKAQTVKNKMDSASSETTQNDTSYSLYQPHLTMAMQNSLGS